MDDSGVLFVFICVVSFWCLKYLEGLRYNRGSCALLNVSAPLLCMDFHQEQHNGIQIFSNHMCVSHMAATTWIFNQSFQEIRRSNQFALGLHLGLLSVVALLDK